MSLTLYYGPMFAGKTEKLIYIYKNKLKILKDLYPKKYNDKISVLKPLCDSRYEGHNKMISHNGDAAQAESIENLTEWFQAKYMEIAVPRYIIVDEVQFFDVADCIAFSELCKNNGSHVFFSGLDYTFDLKPFESVMKLKNLCDWSFLLRGKCQDCEKPSRYSFRKIQKNDKILIGGKDAYEPLCEFCFKLKNKMY